MVNDFSKNLGEKIRKLREQKGLSQKELGDRSGVNQGTISYIERGQASPSIDTIDQISEGLGTTLYALLLDEEDGIARQQINVDMLPFLDWCEKRGLRADIYLKLAMWIVQNLSPIELADAIDAMGTGNASRSIACQRRNPQNTKRCTTNFVTA